MGIRRWLAAAVLVIGASALVAGCAGSGGGSVSSIEGGEWRLERSSGTAVELGTTPATATFSNGTVAGSGGVNSYSAPCTLRGNGSLEVGEITSTLMAGSDEANAAEAAFFGALREMTSWSVEGQELTLSDAAGDVTLTFRR